MGGVEIDRRTRLARVEAGVVWLEVVEAAAQHGLAALAGSSPDVGVVGYTLGGGMSFLGRKYGLAANAVRAIELDLFWALRGGGGSFGVVTALELELFPITEVYAGVLWYPIVRGRGDARLASAHPGRAARCRDDGRAVPDPHADPRDSRARTRQIVRDRRCHPSRLARPGGRAAGRASRARAHHGHDRNDLNASAQQRAHGSRAARPGCRRSPQPRRAAARGDRRTRRGRRRRRGIPAALGRGQTPRGRARTRTARESA